MLNNSAIIDIVFSSLSFVFVNSLFQVRHLRFEEEVEKRRVLEDALHVLATEHHALECSIGAHEVETLRFISPLSIFSLSKNYHNICIVVVVYNKHAPHRCHVEKVFD